MSNGDNLDFCCTCGCWIAADTGSMRIDKDGKIEIICRECEALEQHKACLIGHDKRSGTLDNE